MPISFNADALRKASDVANFPYRAAEVTFLLIKTDGTITQASGVGEKRAMLSAIGVGDLLLAAWTGRYRTDIFLTEPQAAAAAVGRALVTSPFRTVATWRIFYRSPFERPGDLGILLLLATSIDES